jgi:hypothetical protein
MSERTLTDADVRAIVEAVPAQHPCQFTNEEVVLVRRWLGKIDKLATQIGYVVIGVLIAAVLSALWSGIKKSIMEG